MGKKEKDTEFEKTHLKMAFPVFDEIAEDMYHKEQRKMNLNWERNETEEEPKMDSCICRRGWEEGREEEEG